MCILIRFCEEDFVVSSFEAALNIESSDSIFTMTFYFAVGYNVDTQLIEFHLKVNAVLVVESVPTLLLLYLLDNEYTASDFLDCGSPHCFECCPFLELSLHEQSSLFRLVLTEEVIVIFLGAVDGEISLFAFALSMDLVASRLIDDVEGGELKVDDNFCSVLIIEHIAEIASPDGWIFSHGYFGFVFIIHDSRI